MKFRTIKLPRSEKFACSARTLKATFADIENLGIFCGALGKTFEFDSRSRNRPRLTGPVVAQVQVNRQLEAMLTLYPLKNEDYPESAANEFCDSIIHEVHEWIMVQMSKSQTAILGVESLTIEWTGTEHKKHVMRFL